MELLMTFLSSEAGKPYFDIEPLDEPMAVRVRVEGEKDGKACQRVFEAQDYSRRGTTSVASVGHIDGGVGGDWAEGSREPGGVGGCGAVSEEAGSGAGGGVV